MTEDLKSSDVAIRMCDEIQTNFDSRILRLKSIEPNIVLCKDPEGLFRVLAED